ncbi:acyl-CoA synthetase [Conexibacter sp. SYSU D00693]|uniref:acyl-CoA synthetase n=1 Tax=Conexibacter sp. SYSU D00693 TaxID=2812560 RepID=UPI001F11F31B|nr:acyl-CoA synthetase [Conexibacter sp. SYSU D00693]
MSGLFPGAHVAQRGDRPAVVMAGTGETWTYADLDGYATRFARVLRDLGVGVGDHVALCLENRLEVVGVQWGAHYAGTFYTPISTRLGAEELGYVVRDCGAKVLVVSDATAERALEGVADLDGLAVLTVGGERPGARALDDLLAVQGGAPLPDAVDGSEMLYSSGTTGRPKGIRPALPGTPLGTTNILAPLLQGFFAFDADSVYLSPAPYYHASPFKYCFTATGMGATVVLMERFDAEAALAAIERHAITHSQWVPTMLLRMLRLPDEVKARYDLSSHRVAIHAAAPMPVEAKHAMIDWWGPVLHEFYASSEAIGLCHCTSQQWLERPGTVGRAIMGKLEIRDPETGTLLGPGEEGLVCFAEGRPFEYHGDAEGTAEAYTAPGVATVGDIGRVDEDGFLFLTDRRSNLIITGGVNVYPQETEDVLAVHPKVADVAVIGVPNDDFGEEVRAVVQVADGVEPSDELAAELVAYTRERLADVKCPRQVDFRDDLPREPNGKLLKRKLRDAYWADRSSRLV